MSPATASLLGASAVGLSVAIRWRRVFDVTCTGVFFGSQVVFVLVGVLAAPWFIRSPLLTASFSYLHWEYISDADISRCILITAGGLLLVLLGHFGTELFHRSVGGAYRPWGLQLIAPPPVAETFPLIRALILTIIFTTIAFALMLTRLGVVKQGLIDGYLHGNIAAQFDARFQMQSLGRGYYLIVLNALPMLAVLAWIYRLERPSLGSRLWAALSVATASFFLFATFEKRPLVLFALTLALASILKALQRRMSAATAASHNLALTIRRVASALPWRLIVMAIVGPLVLLAGFYFLSTAVAAKYGFGSQLVRALFAIVLLRLFGRLSQMPLFYAHYFPAIHDFYGLSNIGLFSILTGHEVYHDTAEVYSYFSGLPVGSGAIGAITDFYAAFGWAGWALGCVILGAGLYWLDQWMTRLPATFASRALWLMMLVFVSTLSQASIARSLVTYGGGMFVTLWIILSIRVLPRAPVRA